MAIPHYQEHMMERYIAFLEMQRTKENTSAARRNKLAATIKQVTEDLHALRIAKAGMRRTNNEVE